MGEILNENLDELPKEDEVLNETEEKEVLPENNVVEPITRENPLCVISKATKGKNAMRDIQTNDGWGANPYGDAYAVVPDDMVQAIWETRGFCDIELTEDGKEVVSFTAREIPDIPDQTPEESGGDASDVWDEMAAAITEGINEV